LLPTYHSETTEATLTRRERRARLIDSTKVSVLPSGDSAEEDETRSLRLMTSTHGNCTPTFLHLKTVIKHTTITL